jgi:uncharacterized damage-inducible protein DinB
MTRPRPALLTLALTLLAGGALAAQEVPSLVSAYLTDLEDAGGKLAQLAEAMPEATYDWRPMEGVRSVGEVYKHLASDNYLLAAAAGHPAPASTGIEGDDYQTAVAFEERSMEKAEIVEVVRASVDHLEAALRATDASRLTEKVDLFGRETTVEALWLLTLTHLHEHLGQAIAYARSNEVAPPWSR